MEDCLYFTIWIALMVPFVSAYGTCENGSLKGVKCSAGCCYDNDFPGFWKCCERYYNFNPPRTRPVFIEIGSGICGLLVIIFVFICCCICCKKLRRTQGHIDQTETTSVCQQPNRALPLLPLQVISGNVVRNDIAFQDPPPYELLGANCSSESFHQVVNMQSVFDAGNSIGKPPPYELGRDNYSNGPSLQTGNMVQSFPLSNNMAEPPPYAEVVANYNHL
ncbi:uncharacterized protein LOC128209842 [Mya arenaria]|uniref:uncharacterized protein LOC128209842 n=1 Tax=Mya arenaria TaxID=6604 RepID=UPI0022E1A9A3|nr:uncharacterized protein LOC128209842 [Mya arenaria]